MERIICTLISAQVNKQFCVCLTLCVMNVSKLYFIDIFDHYMDLVSLDKTFTTAFLVLYRFSLHV